MIAMSGACRLRWLNGSLGRDGRTPHRGSRCALVATTARRATDGAGRPRGRSGAPAASRSRRDQGPDACLVRQKNRSAETGWPSTLPPCRRSSRSSSPPWRTLCLPSSRSSRQSWPGSHSRSSPGRSATRLRCCVKRPPTESARIATTKMSAAAAPANSPRDGTSAIASRRGTTIASANMIRARP